MNTKVTHKYIRKYKGKNGKWVYIYKEKSNKNQPHTKIDQFTKRLIDKYGNQIRNDKYETIFLFDDKGHVILRKTDNNKTSVNLEKHRTLVKHSTIALHNHPNSFSFSFQDINFALYNNKPKMIVVSKKYTYNMDLQIDKLNQINKNKFYIKYRKIDEEVFYKFKDAIRNNEMTLHEAELQHEHTVWKLMEKEYNGLIKYQRIPNNG